VFDHHKRDCEVDLIFPHGCSRLYGTAGIKKQIFGPLQQGKPGRAAVWRS
jgi:hypothetical protein